MSEQEKPKREPVGFVIPWTDHKGRECADCVCVECLKDPETAAVYGTGTGKFEPVYYVELEHDDPEDPEACSLCGAELQEREEPPMTREDYLAEEADRLCSEPREEW